MKNTLFIIRGLPGSGKSTEAKHLMSIGLRDFKHFEADDFFINPITNEYEFDPSKLNEAHSTCLRNTEKALREGYNVIVSNTFSTLKELKPYQLLADKLSIPMNIRQMNNKFNSIHNVPELVIQNMIKRWQDYPNCAQIPPLKV